LPDGAAYRFESAPVSPQLAGAAAARHADRLVALTARLYRDRDADGAIRELVLWQSYLDALYGASVGARAAAREAALRGLAIDPDSAELRALEHALAAPGQGALPIGPYLLTPRQP
jgi:hypothetical protein